MSNLEQLILMAQSSDRKLFEKALIDLRLTIERYTQNRYSEEDNRNYLRLLSDKKLIDIKLTEKEIISFKYFLFYALFNFPDRSVLVAKCIKVLFDVDAREAICVGIDYYMNKDDYTTHELLLAITDVGDEDSYMQNSRIRNMFIKVASQGMAHSKETALSELKYFEKTSGL